MAALAAARATKSRSLGRLVAYKMADSTTIYAGGMVMINSAGLATPAVAAASNQGIVGVATKTVTNASGGTESILCQEGIFLFVATSIAQSAMGSKVYASDDQTVDETQGTNEPLAGVCAQYVSSTSGWVDISLANSKL
tara:strand:- start:1051 stop:1467 length:417 start_codon:yes stop_codon:yes gene_type:complete